MRGASWPDGGDAKSPGGSSLGGGRFLMDPDLSDFTATLARQTPGKDGTRLQLGNQN